MIFKIIGWTLPGLILLIIILMNFPLRIHISYIEKKFGLEVKFLFLKLYPRKKEKKNDENEEDTITSDDDTEISAEDDAEEESTAGEEAEAEGPPSPADDTEESTAISDQGSSASDPVDDHSDNEGEAETPSEESAQGDEESVEEDKKDSEKPAEKPAKRPQKKQHLADKIIALCDNISEKKDIIFLIIDLVWDHTVKFLKKIYCTDVFVDMEIADEDCAKAAVVYGAVNAAVYNFIGFMKSISRFDVKYTAIDCIYNTPSEKSRYDAEITIRLRPQSLLNLIYVLIFRFIANFKKYKPILSLIQKKK